MIYQVICGTVIVRAFHNQAEAAALCASWRRSGANARVVARAV